MIAHCSQLGAVPHDVVERLRQEVVGYDVPWSENYSKYHSGGWKTAALFNATGKSKENDLEDCHPVPTDLAKRLPAVRQFIETLELKLMWARVLKLVPQACLWEHTDYGAPHLTRAPRVRLHVPLQTQPEAVIVLPAHVVHMKSGFMWKLTPDAARHGACNDGTKDRIHLIIDCYVDDRLEALLAGETLDQDAVRAKPLLTTAALGNLEAQADRLLEQDRLDAVETLFKRAFHRFDLGALSSYDLLAQYFDRRGDTGRRDNWLAERAFFLNTDVPGHALFEPA